MQIMTPKYMQIKPKSLLAKSLNLFFAVISGGINDILNPKRIRPARSNKLLKDCLNCCPERLSPKHSQVSSSSKS